MSITANPKDLAHAVATAARASGKSSTYPILTCLKLEAANAMLNITGSDLDLSITAKVEVTGALSALCVDAQWLLGVVSKLKDRADISITHEDHLIYITSGRSRFTFPTLLSDAFPVLKTPVDTQEIEVEGADFVTVIDALTPAISREATRPYLCGIYLSSGKIADAQDTAHMVAVATTGHLLYARTLAATGFGPGMQGIIVPERTCAHLAKLMPAKGQVRLRLSDNQISMETRDVSLQSKLVEGTFPDWRRLLTSSQPQVSYDTKTLLQAVQTVAAAGNTEKRAQPLKLDFTEDETELSLEGGQGGGIALDFCPHSLLAKPQVDYVGVNPAYLESMLSKLDAETTELALGGHGDQLKITGAACDDRVIVIMSMRV